MKVEKQIQKRKELLSRFQTICDQNKLAHRAVLHSGSPGEGICEIAEQNDVTLILMGSRGLNKMRRTFLGSVSDYVAQHSTRTFTVVPCPK